MLTPIVQPRPLGAADLHGKTLAIDGQGELYQFLALIRLRDGTPLRDDRGRVTSHLSGLFFRTTRLIAEHRLRREIIATTLTNGIVNRCGPATALRLAEEAAQPISEARTKTRTCFDLFPLSVLRMRTSHRCRSRIVDPELRMRYMRSRPGHSSGEIGQTARIKAGPAGSAGPAGPVGAATASIPPAPPQRTNANRISRTMSRTMVASSSSERMEDASS